MPKSRLKVGIAQIDVRIDKVDENRQKHFDFIERARAAKVDLLVFPELSLTGYPESAAEVDRLARSFDDGSILELAAAAKGLTIIAGMIEEAPAAQFYNTGIALSDGEVLYRHRKLNLATYGALAEAKLFASGRYVESFGFHSPWRGSLLICADAWNPALVTLAALHGASLLVLPIASAHQAVSGEFSNPAGWDLVTRFYAMIYGMPVIMANRIGEEKGLSFWGGSAVLDPFGDPIAKASTDEEELLIAELDYAAVRRARLQLPTVRDSNFSLIHREIDRLQTLLGVPEQVRRA